MVRAFLAAIWLTAVLPGTPAPQSPADFSGRWTLESPTVALTPAVPGTPAAASAPGDMGSGWGSTIAITQEGTRLSVEYSVFSRYDLQPPLKFTYALDGSEARNTMMMGRGEQIESSRAHWDAQTLTIRTSFHVDDRSAGKPFTAELTRKLWLASPTTLVVEVTRAGVLGGPASTTRSTYRKN
jgi:hypothetical protein